MSDAVDLTFLREITGGDAAIERELFHVFVESSAENIAALKSCSGDGQADEWASRRTLLKAPALISAPANSAACARKRKTSIRRRQPPSSRCWVRLKKNSAG